jgi:5,10-methylenetetrahydrofolate reductase
VAGLIRILDGEPTHPDPPPLPPNAGEIGVRWTIAQARDLLRRGAPGIHFYVLNRAAHMERIMAGIA